MDKQTAYDFFLKQLSAKLIALQHQLDAHTPGSSQYAAVSSRVVQVQRGLAALDDIANLI